MSFVREKRDEYTKLADAYSRTKDVNILVNESGIESAKTQAARDRGVTIITNLKEII